MTGIAMASGFQNTLPELSVTGMAIVAMGASAHAHVIIDSPNGGEVFMVGQVYTVEWHVAITHNLQNWGLWYSTTGSTGPWIPIATD